MPQVLAVLQGLAQMTLLEASLVSGTSLSFVSSHNMSMKTFTTENASGPPAGSWELVNFLHFYADFPIWASVHFFSEEKRTSHFYQISEKSML